MVFSTYVEVIPIILTKLSKKQCILHVCGGDPYQSTSMAAYHKYSPRMWRWSWWQLLVHTRSLVFSTYVEVILFLLISYVCAKCILHVCGGDPFTIKQRKFHFAYSPRMWRWSSHYQSLGYENEVFSTYVEVILNFFVMDYISYRILHVCGGDPQPQLFH